MFHISATEKNKASLPVGVLKYINPTYGAPKNAFCILGLHCKCPSSNTQDSIVYFYTLAKVLIIWKTSKTRFRSARSHLWRDTILQNTWIVEMLYVFSHWSLRSFHLIKIIARKYCSIWKYYWDQAYSFDVILSRNKSI